MTSELVLESLRRQGIHASPCPDRHRAGSLTQVSIRAFLHVLLQALGLLFQPENQGARGHSSSQQEASPQVSASGKPSREGHPSLCNTCHRLWCHFRPCGGLTTQSLCTDDLTRSSHLLELPLLPSCKQAKGTRKVLRLILSWLGGGRPGSEAPAISHLTLLQFDTHCCSFPYSLSKSRSTCKERESSVNGAMTTRWKKISQLTETCSTPSPQPAATAHPVPTRPSRSLTTVSLCSQTNEVFDLGRRPLLSEGPTRQVGNSQRTVPRLCHSRVRRWLVPFPQPNSGGSQGDLA